MRFFIGLKGSRRFILVVSGIVRPLSYSLLGYSIEQAGLFVPSTETASIIQPP